MLEMTRRIRHRLKCLHLIRRFCFGRFLLIIILIIIIIIIRIIATGFLCQLLSAKPKECIRMIPSLMR